MKVSHNELIIYCGRAFNGLKKRWGEADFIANAVINLEILNLNGINCFISFLESIKKDVDKSIIIKPFYKNNLYVDLKGKSTIVYLPIVVDYALEKIDKEIKIKIIKGKNNWLVLGGLIHFQYNTFFVKGSWVDANKRNIIKYFFNPLENKKEIYLDKNQQKAKKNDNDLEIIISKDKIMGELKHKSVLHYSQEILTTKKKESLENGILIEDKNWRIITELAKATLVPNYADSHLRAGE